MSTYPVMLEASALTAVVAGGGDVGARRALALLEAGATVRVIAPLQSESLGAAAGSAAGDRLTIVSREFEPADLDGASLVVAATNRREVNAEIARLAREAGLLVNVADAPEEGNWSPAATHRAGPLTIAVHAGGVPMAASRIRDAIAVRFDDGYGHALTHLVSLRRSLLDAGEAGRWRELSAMLIGDDFCDAVESGAIVKQGETWD